ncbi:MAG TPA: Flp family type IVb pilin [Pseudoduganella sp.]
MQNLTTMLKQFIRDEEGVTAIEYGLIAALIAVVIIIAVRTVGTQLDITFDKIAEELTAANAAGGAGGQ